MKKTLSTLLVAAAIGLLPLAGARAGDEFTPAQKDEIGKIVHDYLLAHPEVLLDVSRELEKRQQAAQDDLRQQAVARHAEELFRSPADLVAGNPKGDVTMVEFFDYNCGWCKKGLPEVVSLVKEDSNLRFVLKEFPIFGADSEYAAMAALASNKQGKYWPFHIALLEHQGKVTKEVVDEIAVAQGLNLEQLKKDMEAPEIADTLVRNQKLAEALAISGTPAFIIDNKIVPGYLPKSDLAATIKGVRDQGGCSVC
jgi:protein-disulfide isomerase